jgi:pimeloyl-ACP methyl ester carboxylesterase
LNDQDWFEELWSKKQIISDKPALFIWGMKDPVIKPKILDKFASGFTSPSLIKLETSGHFPQEEQPEIAIKSLPDFLSYKKPGV